MSLFDQCIEGGQQFFNIMKMQTGGRFIKNEQELYLLLCPLPRKEASFTRCASPPERVSDDCPSFT